MHRRIVFACTLLAIFAVAAAILRGQSPTQKSAGAHKPRNIVIFVSDGMRAGSVNAEDAPTMFWVRTHGVAFPNSHSLFPTFTTANASAIATGHYLGDTGDYSNQIYIGRPVFFDGTLGRAPGSYAPYIENDAVLADLDAQFQGNYLNEETLLAAAREHGYSTAMVGKMGPAAIQDASQLNPVDRKFAVPQTLVIDDGTGTADGVPLSPELAAALTSAGLPTVTPRRNQPTGTNEMPGTKEPNVTQQAYFADATTRAILPLFRASRKPFALVFWSRDPDGTQHFQGDSLNTLTPGINGPTSKAAVHNADNNFKQIMDTVEANPDWAGNTDFFLTADHGFATISKHEIDAAGHVTSSYSAQWTYKDSHGRQEVNTGFLPQGFLAIDIAHALGLPLFDPDSQIKNADGKVAFEPVDPTIPEPQANMRQHPAGGNGLIGGTGRLAETTDAQVVLAANGGSDLLYLPVKNPELLRKIVAFLATQDYVDGIFVRDDYGDVPGALRTSTICLYGSSPIPSPDIAVTFKTFVTDAKNPAMTTVQVTDYGLQEGQGMHGGFGRGLTLNFMAVYGPDFKKGFSDAAPISNADIAPTLAQILGFHRKASGSLTGRVLRETLSGGPASVAYRARQAVSKPAASGKATVLMYQEAGGRVYFDRSCFTRISDAGLPSPCD